MFKAAVAFSIAVTLSRAAYRDYFYTYAIDSKTFVLGVSVNDSPAVADFAVALGNRVLAGIKGVPYNIVAGATVFTLPPPPPRDAFVKAIDGGVDGLLVQRDIPFDLRNYAAGSISEQGEISAGTPPQGVTWGPTVALTRVLSTDPVCSFVVNLVSQAHDQMNGPLTVPNVVAAVENDFVSAAAGIPTPTGLLYCGNAFIGSDNYTIAMVLNSTGPQPLGSIAVMKGNRTVWGAKNMTMTNDTVNDILAFPVDDLGFDARNTVQSDLLPFDVKRELKGGNLTSGIIVPSTYDFLANASVPVNAMIDPKCMEMASKLNANGSFPDSNKKFDTELGLMKNKFDQPGANKGPLGMDLCVKLYNDSTPNAAPATVAMKFHGSNVSMVVVKDGFIGGGAVVPVINDTVSDTVRLNAAQGLMIRGNTSGEFDQMLISNFTNGFFELAPRTQLGANASSGVDTMIVPDAATDSDCKAASALINESIAVNFSSSLLALLETTPTTTAPPSASFNGAGIAMLSLLGVFALINIA